MTRGPAVHYRVPGRRSPPALAQIPTWPGPPGSPSPPPRDDRASTRAPPHRSSHLACVHYSRRPAPHNLLFQ